MTSQALIRELATKPEFRILSELGREIVEKVWETKLKEIIDNQETEPEIAEGMEKFRQALTDLDIATIEGKPVGKLSDHELYERVVCPIHMYFIREIPVD